MSQRDEQAREKILWAIGMHCSHTGEPLPEPAEPCPSCSLITTEVLERFESGTAALLGYVKADSEEWAVRFAGPGGLPLIDAMHIPDRMTGSYVIADEYADDPTARTVRRLVGPWEVA
ncbi:hypothetical protein [Rhodococcus sp. BE178]|uniref:hypothetical protein n=1 Tax=Rhodococcus sp. BE178 TaxID=2817737 RepID=UPI003D191DC7